VNEVSSAIDDLADIGQQTSGEANRVAAAAEEQAATLLSMSEDMNGLAEQTDQLQALVDRFRLNADSDEIEPKQFFAAATTRIGSSGRGSTGAERE